MEGGFRNEVAPPFRSPNLRVAESVVDNLDHRGHGEALAICYCLSGIFNLLFLIMGFKLKTGNKKSQIGEAHLHSRNSNSDAFRSPRSPAGY